jgi:type VI secretion system protein ImpK
MRLTDCFIEMIAYVAYLMKAIDKRQPSFDEVQNNIRRMIADSEKWPREDRLSQEDYDQARFAVFAWIDEMILNSSWNERKRWQGEQLQLLYYNTSEAGELFFERLSAIGPHQRDVREVYYLCLAMGFLGRYCQKGDEFLIDGLKTSNLKLLIGSSVGIPSLAHGELFPEAYPEDGQAGPAPERRSRFSFFTLACIGFPVVLYGGLFLIYRFILSNVGDSLMKAVP